MVVYRQAAERRRCHSPRATFNLQTSRRREVSGCCPPIDDETGYLEHIPLNSRHPNKKARYSTPSIATVAPLPRNSGCQGQAPVRCLDRKKRRLRTKAPMAAAANNSQAAIRMIPPVGAAIGKNRCPAKARSAISPENKAAPKTHAARAANANGRSRTPCCSNAAPASTAAAWNRSI
jgi:hypothetical protein